MSAPRSVGLSRLARLASCAALCAASSLVGCTQDGYSSNPNDRDTHMGDLKAAPPAPASAAPPGPAAAVPAPTPAPAPAPAPSPSASQ